MSSTAHNAETLAEQCNSVRSCIETALKEAQGFEQAHDALKATGIQILTLVPANLSVTLHQGDTKVQTDPIESRNIQTAETLDKTAVSAIIAKIWEETTLFSVFFDQLAAAGVHAFELNFEADTMKFHGKQTNTDTDAKNAEENRQTTTAPAQTAAQDSLGADNNTTQATDDDNAEQTQSAQRLKKCFAALKAENKSALVTFIMAGDPNYDVALEALKNLPKAGADIVELGMPFTDPMADGLSIQHAAQRALANGQNMKKTLEMARVFRKENPDTPLILMGYYNPIYIYGPRPFLEDAKAAGVDGVIVVDLPPEEDNELCRPAHQNGIDFIRLATPTTNKRRLPKVLKNASGFIYFVSVTGVTGAAAPNATRVSKMIGNIQAQTDLPIAVGFGVRQADQAAELARAADGVVVGSAIVELVGKGEIDTALKLVGELADAIHNARSQSANLVENAADAQTVETANTAAEEHSNDDTETKTAVSEQPILTKAEPIDS